MAETTGYILAFAALLAAGLAGIVVLPGTHRWHETGPHAAQSEFGAAGDRLRASP